MPFQKLIVNTFAAIKAVITPPPSPPPSPFDSPTAKAIKLPSGYIAYDAEKAFQLSNSVNSPNISILVQTK
jgi:hypothetical protein